MSGSPTIASSSRVTLLWAGSRVEVSAILSFAARQVVETEPQHPLNDDPTVLVKPNGWQGRIVLNRYSSAVDRLFYDIEQAYSVGGGQPWSAQGTRSVETSPGTIYHDVAEPDGSETTFEFSRVGAYLSDAGTYEMGRPVIQTIEFFAARRTIL